MPETHAATVSIITTVGALLRKAGLLQGASTITGSVGLGAEAFGTDETAEVSEQLYRLRGYC